MALTNCDTVALSLNGQLISERTSIPIKWLTGRCLMHLGSSKQSARRTDRSRAFHRGNHRRTHVIAPHADRTEIAGDGRDAVRSRSSARLERPPVPTRICRSSSRSAAGRDHRRRQWRPEQHDPEKGNKVNIFNGLAQVILQSQNGGSGPLVLDATSTGLTQAETTITVKAVPSPPAVPDVAQ